MTWLEACAITAGLREGSAAARALMRSGRGATADYARFVAQDLDELIRRLKEDTCDSTKP